MSFGGHHLYGYEGAAPNGNDHGTLRHLLRPILPHGGRETEAFHRATRSEGPQAPLDHLRAREALARRVHAEDQLGGGRGAEDQRTLAVSRRVLGEYLPSMAGTREADLNCPRLQENLAAASRTSPRAAHSCRISA